MRECNEHEGPISDLAEVQPVSCASDTPHHGDHCQVMLMSYAAPAVYPLTRWMIVGFASGVVLHNLEEAASFVPWMKRHFSGLWLEPDSRIYSVLTSLVSLVICLVAVGLLIWPDNRQLLYALSGFAMAMSINAVFPHGAASLMARSYCPGTASGILLNFPFGIWFVSREMSRGWLTWSDIWRHSFPYTLALAMFAFGSLYLAHIIRRPIPTGAM